MTWDHLAALVAAIALLSNVVATIVGLALRNAMLHVKDELTIKVSTIKSELEEQVDMHERAIRELIERNTRDCGETVIAVRTKIHEVEVWSRDTFVRRDDEVINALKGGIERIETRLERMENNKPK